MDSQYGKDLIETVEASLNPLLQSLDTDEITALSSLLVDRTHEPVLQHRLLEHLPIHPSSLAVFRQSLAKQFLNIPPNASSSALLTYLQSNYPFTEIKRDISNEHTRNIIYAMLIFDIAISQPPMDQAETTREIIRELQNMHRRIIDGRAAFLVRTEAKEIIQRTWMRLEYALMAKRKTRIQTILSNV